MTKLKLTNLYWILFIVVQIYLVIEKVQSEDFLLWNIVSIIASAIFLFYRFRHNRILKTYEQVIIIFFILNCISNFVYQIRIENDILKLVVIPILTILSGIVIYLIKDFKEDKS